MEMLRVQIFAMEGVPSRYRFIAETAFDPKTGHWSVKVHPPAVVNGMEIKRFAGTLVAWPTPDVAQEVLSPGVAWQAGYDARKLDEPFQAESPSWQAGYATADMEAMVNNCG